LAVVKTCRIPRSARSILHLRDARYDADQRAWFRKCGAILEYKVPRA
jgi:hypothetical protein